jgi:hypothetical protein
MGKYVSKYCMWYTSLKETLHMCCYNILYYFRHHLERAYRLCPPCEEVLKQTLHKQKSMLLGVRLKQLHNTSLHAKVSMMYIIILKN